MRVSTDQIWSWLDAVPDPEIPVISVVDLGIVRDVRWDADTLVVTVTPTYSGCPATSIISMDIETALRDHGIGELRIETSISPANPRSTKATALGLWRGRSPNAL